MPQNHAYAPAPSPAELREEADPTERIKPIPLAVVVVTLAMVLTGVAYIITSDAPGPSVLGDRRTLADLAGPVRTAGAADGKQVYTANCVACHQAGGTGLPGVFPPLDGSEWAVGDARVLANILLHGINGEITVKGATYKGSMPAFKQLGDEELAAVATYVRSTWSNKAEPLKAELFAAERKAGTREQPFEGGAALKALAAARP